MKIKDVALPEEGDRKKKLIEKKEKLKKMSRSQKRVSVVNVFNLIVVFICLWIKYLFLHIIFIQTKGKTVVVSIINLDKL